MLDMMPYLSSPDIAQELAKCGDYSLVHEIGRGGMAVVFLAITPNRSAQRVALKIAMPSLVQSKHDALERFDREITFQSSLNCPHVVPLLKSGWSPNAVGSVRLPWFAMELIKGRSLADKLAKWQRLTQTEVARLGRQICQGLASIHKLGVVHRDLKPSNVLLDIANSERAIIGDFGVARSMSPEFPPITQGYVGTFRYIAPEVWDDLDSASYASDLFSVGCILFEALVGKPAFEQKQLASKNSQRVHPCDIDASLNRGLAELIYRLMNPKPTERCESAQQAARDFEIVGLCIADTAVDDGYRPGLTNHSTCEALGAVAQSTFFLPEFRGASQTSLLLGLAGQKLATRKLHRRIERLVDNLILFQDSGATSSSRLDVDIKEAEKTFLSVERRLAKTLQELEPNEKFPRFSALFKNCESAIDRIRSILQLLQASRHKASELERVRAQAHELVYVCLKLESEATELEVFVTDLFESSMADFSAFRPSDGLVAGYSPFLKQNRIKTDLTVDGAP